MLKGGSSLERTVSLRSGAHVAGRAGAPRPRGRRDRRRPRPGRRSCSSCGPTRRSSRCTDATARTGRCRGCWRRSAALHRLGPAACMRCTDKVLAKYLMREAGIPTPDFAALKRERHQRPRRGGGAAARRATARVSRWSSSRPRQGSALGVKFARAGDELPGAIVGALSYDRKVLLERYVKGRDLAVSVLDARARPGRARAGGAAGRRGDPARRGLLRLRVAL